jgi:hypothetical protein
VGAFCLERKVTPRALRNTPVLLADVQSLLRRQGVELSWPPLEPM